MDETRRTLLQHLAAGPVAGTDLANELEVSRAAIWKHVEALRAEGFEIEATDAGYAVETIPEYGGGAVQFGLGAPYTVTFERRVESTNDRARQLATAGKSDMVVLAHEQTGGRGRRGRSWAGPPGGIYLSLLIRPTLPPAEAPLLTMAASVAIVEGLEHLGVQPAIKWPNDVLVDGAKVAGILTEMEGEADAVSWVIVGIGINANVDATDLPDTAASLEELIEEPVNRRKIVQQLLERFHELHTEPGEIRDRWRELATTPGQLVQVETLHGTLEGEAIDIDDNGALLVETDDSIERIHAGDCRHLRPSGGESGLEENPPNR